MQRGTAYSLSMHGMKQICTSLAFVDWTQPRMSSISSTSSRFRSHAIINGPGRSAMLLVM